MLYLMSKMHDLIVVGAGTAGCVLAERLTGSGKLRVLLVESGGKPSSPFVGIPAGFAKLFRSKLDWNLESEPQIFAGGRRIYIPRGRMLGGSSCLNAQIHQWCHPADFDEWAESGCTGWSWSDVAPVFFDQEHWSGEGRANRGNAGRLAVTNNPSTHSLSKAFVDSARTHIAQASPEYNGFAYEGSWLCEVTNRDGRRNSAYDAWLKPALGRPNLHVITNSHATRIEFDGVRATGVTVTRGHTETTHGAGGVILAAGSFGSPQLLMLSGAGPGRLLSSLGIPVRHDCEAVGANLQDHPMVPLVFSTARTDTLKNAESPANLLRYLIYRKGMLASNAVEAFAFARSNSALRAPDIELIFAPFEWRNQGLEPPSVHAFAIGAAVVSPRSRGKVTLRTRNPGDKPAVDFSLLSDAEHRDREALSSAIDLARKVAATEPLGRQRTGELDPGESVTAADELDEWISRRLQTVYHPTSTCRMGSDAAAVVDPELRVSGFERLWIADASVMPSVPRGHPNAAVAMIAQRAAGFIERHLVHRP